MCEVVGGVEVFVCGGVRRGGDVASGGELGRRGVCVGGVCGVVGRWEGMMGVLCGVV